MIGAAADDATRDWPFHHMATTFEMNLTDKWHFSFDADDSGFDERWYEPDFQRKDWDSVEVPGIWGYQQGKVPVNASSARNKVGWYAREIELPAGDGDEAALVFLGSMFITDAWLDGKYIGHNRGGYTPFMFEVGELIGPGETAKLVVRVDGRLSSETIPKSGTGWDTYGGLTREVFLIARPRARVEGLRTVSEVEGRDGPASLKVSGEIVNHDESRFEDTLEIVLFADGDEAARENVAVSVGPGSTSALGLELNISRPRLWSPDDPFLHELELRWAGAAYPHIKMPVGLRQVEIDGPHFLLNGERLWLQGFGQHELVSGYGPSVPPGWHESELERIKRFGANHFRTGHYPQHPELYAAADRLGLLVFTEIPAWQMNRSWIQTDRAWDEWAKPQLSAMIRWYRNFTSVVSWGAANETGGVRRYDERAVEFMSEKDPSRLPMIVVAATGNMHLYDILPMAGRNLHYGWYHSPRPYGARAGLLANLKRAEKADTPIWVAELGAHARPGRVASGYYDGSRGTDTETYLDQVIRFGFQHNATASERVSGIAIWTWSDFLRGNRLHFHGILDYEREPKLAAYTLRNLFEGDLRLFLAEADTRCEPGGIFEADAFVFNPRLQEIPDGLNIRWRIMRKGRTVAEGALPVDPGGTARAVNSGTIEWDIPEDARGMHSLWAELTADGDEWIHTNAVHFGVQEAERPGGLFLTAKSGGKPVDASANLAGVTMPVYADPGLIIPLSEGEYELSVEYDGEEKEITVEVQSGKPVRKAVKF